MITPVAGADRFTSSQRAGALRPAMTKPKTCPWPRCWCYLPPFFSIRRPGPDIRCRRARSFENPASVRPDLAVVRLQPAGRSTHDSALQRWVRSREGWRADRLHRLLQGKPAQPSLHCHSDSPHLPAADLQAICRQHGADPLERPIFRGALRPDLRRGASGWTAIARPAASMAPARPPPLARRCQFPTYSCARHCLWEDAKGDAVAPKPLRSWGRLPGGLGSSR